MTEIEPPEPTDIRPITDDKVEIKWEDVEKIYGDLTDLVIKLSEKAYEMVDGLLDCFPPYMVKELTHPQKKPRGSIRRAKRAKRAKKRGNAE